MRRAFSLFIRGLAAALLVFLLWLVAVWPPPIWFRSHWPAETAFMAMRQDQKPAAGEARSPGPRLYRPVPLDSIAPVMQRAATTGEDERFWEHHGIDYLAILHALGYRGDSFAWSSPRDRRTLLRLLSTAWQRRDALRGASTITQQLAKNLYLSPSRNPLRKLKEAVTAWRLEAALGKQRILELYLNTVEMGRDIWGVEAASRYYFHRPAAHLTTDQAAALAGELPFPLHSNPGFRPGRMRWRQDLILRRMRGEPVEIPPAPDLDSAPVLPDLPEIVPLPDSGVPPAGTGNGDSGMDSSTKGPPIPEGPEDTLRSPLLNPDSSLSPPAAGASPG